MSCGIADQVALGAVIGVGAALIIIAIATIVMAVIDHSGRDYSGRGMVS